MRTVVESELAVVTFLSLLRFFLLWKKGSRGSAGRERLIYLYMGRCLPAIQPIAMAALLVSTHLKPSTSLLLSLFNATVIL